MTTTVEVRDVARHQGRNYNFEAFRASVAFWSESLSRQDHRRYALFCDDAYPFAVLLFALLHSGKQVWLPGNNRPGTAEHMRGLGCELLGDWWARFDYRLEARPRAVPVWQMLDARQTQLIIFTSGSTGTAQAISKSLRQLQAEVETLEQLWGEQLADSLVLATVSHQHIYGLLFRVLWPLAAGRCFQSEMAIDPENILDYTGPAAWIASPAQLKRLGPETAWDKMAALRAVFSSGGPLPAQAAGQIVGFCGRAVIEVYGSSETGGIAWRRHPEPAWTLFDGLSMTATDAGALLQSPYLPGDAPYPLNDTVCLQTDGRFLLLGRSDRIVKIEEKRLSLTELENRLMDSGWFDAAAALALDRRRDTVAVAGVLSASGLDRLQRQGRNALVKQWRTELLTWFEPVLLPRRWLFLNRLPQTAQGKLDTALLEQLLNREGGKLPLPQALAFDGNRADLELKVPPDLLYFADHFPGYPILPGVVQIGWVQQYGRLLFAFNGEFSSLEAVKFVKPILPGYELDLQLNWHEAGRKLQFQFTAAGQSVSSGRLVYRGGSA